MSIAPRFGCLQDGTGRPVEGAETFTDLLREGGVRVERILSRGAASPPGFWYEQGWTEFVLLVAGAATLGFPDGAERRLEPGEWAILPAGCRHRVTWTDPTQETVWLAVHLPVVRNPGRTSSSGEVSPTSRAGS